MPKIIGNPVGVPNPKSDLAQTDPTKADYVKNKKLSLFENDKGYLTEEDKPAITEDIINSIPKAYNGSGQYGLIKLGSNAKGIDLTGDGELILKQASLANLENNSTQLVVTKPSLHKHLIALGTHQQMNDTYDVYTINVPDSFKGRQAELPVSYAAVKAYVDSITAGKDGITPHIAENENWWIGTTDTGIKAKGTNGKDGHTPIKGTDYYTDADKAEMVNAVLSALPNGDEVSY